jgi:hypothetical protein
MNTDSLASKQPLASEQRPALEQPAAIEQPAVLERPAALEQPAVVVEDKAPERGAPARRGRKTAAKKVDAAVVQASHEQVSAVEPTVDAAPDIEPAKPPRKSASGAGRSRKVVAEGTGG